MAPLLNRRTFWAAFSANPNPKISATKQLAATGVPVVNCDMIAENYRALFGRIRLRLTFEPRRGFPGDCPPSALMRKIRWVAPICIISMRQPEIPRH